MKTRRLPTGCCASPPTSATGVSDCASCTCVTSKGFGWNHKRVYQIYRALEAQSADKTPKRLVRAKPEPLAVPDQPNHCWSMDFMHDQLSDGRSVRLFNVIDDFNPRNTMHRVDFPCLPRGVKRVLEQVIEWRANQPLSAVIMVRNTSAKSSSKWAQQKRIAGEVAYPARQPAAECLHERFNRTSALTGWAITCLSH